MLEGYLIAIFIVLIITALLIVAYPLSLKTAWHRISVLLFVLMVPIAYGFWGGWSEWRDHRISKQRERQVVEKLNQYKSKQELIADLKQKVIQSPKNAKGWYLLGRLYVSEGNWLEAKAAFEMAASLQPNDVSYKVNLAHTEWQLNGQSFNEVTRSLYKEVLSQDPNQPDALSMLAMDAYLSHDYKKAINYWEALLKLVPPRSEDAKTVAKAIAKAQEILLNSRSKNDG